MGNGTCFGHLNEFTHLDVDLGGVEQEFDLGVKFELQDARQPFWVAFVSYTSIGEGPVHRGTLRVAVGESDAATRDQPPDVAQQSILRQAKQHIAGCLRAIKGGVTPRACREVEFV